MTPIQVGQYLGKRKDNLKFGCKTLFLLTGRCQLIEFDMLHLPPLYRLWIAG